MTKRNKHFRKTIYSLETKEPFNLKLILSLKLIHITIPSPQNSYPKHQCFLS